MNAISKTASGRFRLITLLHIAEGAEPTVNLRRGIDPVLTYIKCAELCASSAAAFGLELTVITNQADIAQRYKSETSPNGLHFEVVDFKMMVPPHIAFHSAHYKIELINLIGKGAFGNLVGLIDLDTVILGSLNVVLEKSDSLQVYDISHSIIAEYGEEVVRRDLEKVSGMAVGTPIWYGGEYLVGTKQQFDSLSKELDACWTRYLENISDLHHIGDEMVVSAALLIAKEAGLRLFDAGVNHGIARWWTARTGFVQRPFSEASQAAILHLPSDKDFLASRSSAKFDRDEFLADYLKHAKRKIFRRRLLGSVDRFRGRPRRYVGRLS